MRLITHTKRLDRLDYEINYFFQLNDLSFLEEVYIEGVQWNWDQKNIFVQHRECTSNGLALQEVDPNVNLLQYLTKDDALINFTGPWVNI